MGLFCCFTSLLSLFKLDSSFLVFRLPLCSLVLGFLQLQSHLLAFLVQLLSSILGTCHSFSIIFDLEGEFLHLLLTLAGVLDLLGGSSGLGVKIALQLHDALFQFADRVLQAFASIVLSFFDTDGELRHLLAQQGSSLLRGGSSLLCCSQLTHEASNFSGSFVGTVISSTSLVLQLIDFFLKGVVVSLSLPLSSCNIVVHCLEFRSAVNKLLFLASGQFTSTVAVLESSTGFVELDGQIVSTSVGSGGLIPHLVTTTSLIINHGLHFFELCLQFLDEFGLFSIGAVRGIQGSLKISHISLNL